MNAKESSSMCELPNVSLEPLAKVEKLEQDSIQKKDGAQWLAWRWTLSAPLWLVPLWAALAFAVRPTPFTTLAGCLTLLLIAVCSYTDIRWARIRNTVIYSTLLFALLLAAFDTWCCRPPLTEPFADPPVGAVGLLGESGVRLSEYLGSVGLVASLGGAGVAFLIMFPIYLIAGGGGGDVKLATVLGALLGPSSVVQAIIWTYVTAGLAILIWLVVTLGPLKIGQWVFRKVGARLAPAHVAPPIGDEYLVLQGKIRLGPFFALGTLAVLSGIDSYLGFIAGG